jgi:hypothetical protein
MPDQIGTRSALGWLAEREGDGAGSAWRLFAWRAADGEGTPLFWHDEPDVVWAASGGAWAPGDKSSAWSTSWVRQFIREPSRARELTGVFAVVAIDKRAGRIVVAGDRLGVQAVH